jgi:hypothetical protein
MSYRISAIERDLSGFISGTIDETGAMVLYSSKGRKDKPLLCYTEDDVIVRAGYPSSTYPSVFEAISFVRKAPLYVISPFGTYSLWGGVDVKSGSVVAFSGGREDPDDFDYTLAHHKYTQTLGTSNGVTKHYSGTLTNVPVDNGYLRIKVGANYIDGTDYNSGIIAGDDIDGNGTIEYTMGGCDFTLKTAPTSGNLVVAEYQSIENISANVSHSFFATSPYTDDLSVSIESITGTQFKLTLYKKSSTTYNMITEYTYSLTKEKDGFGASLYIEDVFKDDDYLIPKVNTAYTGTTFSVDSTYVDLAGGHRTDPLASDYTTAWAFFNKIGKYPVKIFMDAIGGYAGTINTIINTYQNYAHGLSILSINKGSADLVTERQGLSLDSDNVSLYCNWFKIQDVYNNSQAWISNIGSIGGKYALMADIYDSGAPAGVDEDSHGGQLTDWQYLESDQDIEEGEYKVLDEAQINPVIFDPTYGCMVYGDKTAQVSLSDTSYIGTRRVYNYIEDQIIKGVLRKQVFKNNDEAHRNRAREMIIDFMDATVMSVGGLREYYCQCDEFNNNDKVLNLRKFIVDLFVKATPTSEFVQLRLTRVSQTQVIAELIAK